VSRQLDDLSPRASGRQPISDVRPGRSKFADGERTRFLLECSQWAAGRFVRSESLGVATRQSRRDVPQSLRPPPWCAAPLRREGDVMPVPAFREDGYLPEGLHRASEGEVIAHFGVSTPRRVYLVGRLRRWLELAREVGARRFFIDGSFVTEKAEPGDVDAVVWLPDSFREQVSAGRPEAIELQAMVSAREPRELFAAYSVEMWDGWLEFFSRTREPDARRKGVVEIAL
jgi:hypothetical protein